MRVVKGTRIKEVSEQQLRDEIKVYSNAGVDEPVSAKLRAVRSKYLGGTAPGGKTRPRDQTNMIHDLVGTLRTLLDEYVPQASEQDDDSDISEEDAIFMSARTRGSGPAKGGRRGVPKSAAPSVFRKLVERVPVPDKELPSWAPKDCLNARGTGDVSAAHYTSLCRIGNGVIEAMLDTGGARSMIDLQTAEMLGLEVERTTSTKYFGCFYSASAVPTPYAGRVKGPVDVQFSDKVTFQMKELKVIHYPEPLVLIGTDLLGMAST
jgi:hypothetical protein